MTPLQFEAKHAAVWNELEAALAPRSKQSRGTRRADRARVAALYRAACEHLAIAESRSYPVWLIDRLGSLTARGHQLVYAQGDFGIDKLRRLFGVDFPAAVRAHRLHVLIALVAFVGTINASGGDLGVLVPLEHAVLAHGASDQRRTQVFARYSLIGSLCTAAGSLAASLPDFLVAGGSTQLGAFRLMFYAYAMLGIVCAALYRFVPHARGEERAPQAPLGPSRGTVYKLAALFSIDSFAGGFVAQSLLVLWLFERFDLSLSAAGLFFFWSSTLSAFSYPVAAWIAKRIGLVNTMVFTHIPSSIFLILAAFAPNLYVALGLLLLRSALSQMDVPTRTSYVMAVVTPAERPAAASVTAVPRSLASAISPAISGALLMTSFAGLPLVVCGALKIVYDLALLVSFRHIKPPEERDS